MKIAVPISRVDVNRLDTWLSCVRKFAGLENHSIHLIPTYSVAQKAYGAAAALGDLCKDVRVEALDMDSDLGWPKAPNWHWLKTCQIMETLSVPWFWMELDCLPVRAGWASELGSAYASSGNPFLGCIVPTPYKDPQTGKEVASPDPDDKMMCGCGIYPSYLIKRFGDVRQPGLLADLSKGDSSAEDPWDLHLRNVMRKLGMGHTDLIADHWNTQNYRVEDNRLICDPKLTDGNGNPANVKRHGQVNPSAVVIHGCKDDSLAQLIVNGLDTRTLAPIIPIIQKQGGIISQSTETDPRIEAMEKQLAQMKEMLAAALTRPTNTPPPTLETVYTKPKSQTTEEIPFDSGLSDQEKIVRCIQGSKTKLRLAQVSGLTGIPQNTIRAIGANPDAPFNVGAGGLAWLSIKTTAKA